MVRQLPVSASVRRISTRSSPVPKTATAVECSRAAFTVDRSGVAALAECGAYFERPDLIERATEA
ncbi:hypothetical protein AB0D46_27975, partial [Streptomyces sp. NPDC048383]|uniref:hypothetical protein n=1 Tax=Streptomyces sp. NPDC048383 TaxID=3155386 RepID=UPI00342A26CF